MLKQLMLIQVGLPHPRRVGVGAHLPKRIGIFARTFEEVYGLALREAMARATLEKSVVRSNIVRMRKYAPYMLNNYSSVLVCGASIKGPGGIG